MENVDTDGTLDFEIAYNQIRVEDKTVKGHWNFNFTANGAALAIDTMHIPMDESYVLPNGAMIRLTEYTSNNLGTKIYFEISDVPENDGAEYNMILEGKDNLGNKVGFYMSYLDGEGNGRFKISDPLNENAKIITLKPYAVKFPENKKE